MIQENILKLADYGLATGLIQPEDRQYTINRLLELFELDELEEAVAEAHEKEPKMTQQTAEEALETILKEMMDYAHAQGILKEDSIVYRDLFDTKIMSLLARKTAARGADPAGEHRRGGSPHTRGTRPPAPATPLGRGDGQWR